MSFKDQIQSDLAVFINTGEFADTHNIDDQDIPAVIDRDILKQRSQRVERVDGVYSGEALLFVRLSDLPARPVVDQRMRVDSELFYVVDCNENDGLLEITLGANRA